MLFNPLGSGKPIRVQGAFISDDEVNSIIDFVKAQNEETRYSENVLDSIGNCLLHTVIYIFYFLL